MQINSTPSIAKSERLTIIVPPEIESLLAIYYKQAMLLADAEQAGLPEPEINCPPLPSYIKWKH